MAYRVDPRSDVPPSRQLVEAVLDAVARGGLSPGDRAPSVRALAEEALVNPNTVGKAYRDLEALGVVEGRNGSGVYVTADGPTIARAARERSTLDAFRAAAAAALRAGHDPESLAAALASLLDADPRTLARRIS
ncbi:MAG: GntR family transcriptional regulator [Planctomycetes bacterium]|nr:GntR family transcriptional regulator [Planctomycetota bacterium]